MRTSQLPGLSLSFLICTMVRKRLGLPALTFGSKHPLRSGNSSHLRTLSDLCPHDPDLPLWAVRSRPVTSGLIRALAYDEHDEYDVCVAKQLPVPQKSVSSVPSVRQLFLPAQEMSAPGEAELGLFRNSSISRKA